MKVLTAMAVAWTLRAVYLFGLADRIEEWAGIAYDADEYKVGGSE